MGNGALTVPLAASPGRGGFGAQLALAYDSNAGNGPFGLGWSVGLASVTRKTDKGLPLYNDAQDSDVFVLSAAEDLVPVLKADGGILEAAVNLESTNYVVRRYRPDRRTLRPHRALDARERWDAHWRATTRDNLTSVYGLTVASQISNPDNPQQVFSWLICESFDDKGNAMVFEYAAENERNVEVGRIEERLRTPAQRAANRYIKAVRYSNTVPCYTAADLRTTQWLFTLLFDYGEGHLEPSGTQTVDRGLAQANFAATRSWPARQDPLARSGFDVRTHRLCRRVLMFHHFAEELGAPDVLVRSTDFTYAEDPIATTLTRVTHSGYVRQADGRYCGAPCRRWTWNTARLRSSPASRRWTRRVWPTCPAAWTAPAGNGWIWMAKAPAAFWPSMPAPGTTRATTARAPSSQAAASPGPARNWRPPPKWRACRATRTACKHSTGWSIWMAMASSNAPCSNNPAPAFTAAPPTTTGRLTERLPRCPTATGTIPTCAWWTSPATAWPMC